MQEPIHFIALRQVKHNDRQRILTVYSRELGRLSLAVTAGAGKAANRVRALVQPLSVAEGIIDCRPSQEVFPVHSISPSFPLSGLYLSPLKQIVAQFLAEFLTAVLGESHGDVHLFEFICSSIKLLDKASPEQVANFHLCFLTRLTAFLGIEPDSETYSPGMVLDMREGCWRITPPLHEDYLDGDNAVAAHRVLQMNYNNMGAFRYNRQERAQVLDCLIKYYSIHYIPLRNLKSLAVLRSVLIG